jgi:A/G-specific adenine glycosylase
VPGEHVKTLIHGVTRFRITLDCYEAEFRSNDKPAADGIETRWLRPAELDRYPLSSTGRKLAMLIRTPYAPRDAVCLRGA